MATVHIAAGRSGPDWFGVVWEGTSYVATAKGSTREEAMQRVVGCMPEEVDVRLSRRPSSFLESAVTMLGELERGDESNKLFAISTAYRSETTRAILVAAATIPIGYVTTYGNIAAAARSEARAVGRVMATNPLYPIVPCHRVVGSDMSLVGYGGRQTVQALEAKLARLAAEARGAVHVESLPLPGGLLTVYPVEKVIQAARASRERRDREAELKAQQEEADRLQRRLF